MPRGKAAAMRGRRFGLHCVAHLLTRGFDRGRTDVEVARLLNVGERLVAEQRTTGAQMCSRVERFELRLLLAVTAALTRVALDSARSNHKRVNERGQNTEYMIEESKGVVQRRESVSLQCELISIQYSRPANT